MDEKPKKLRDLNHPDYLLQFIPHVHACSEDKLRTELDEIVLDRELTMLGRMVVMVRELHPEKFCEFGTSNEALTAKLDMLAAKVGHLMPRQWRGQYERTPGAPTRS